MRSSFTTALLSKYAAPHPLQDWKQVMGVVGAQTRNFDNWKSETLLVSMDTTLLRTMARPWGHFGLEIRKRLDNALNDLKLFFSSAIAKRMAQRELKGREAQQTALSYEARKRELLIALRQKISERRTK
jgi:hypothetical protein